MLYIIYTLIFVSVTLGALGLLTLVTTSRAQQRMQAMLQPAKSSSWLETVVQVVGPFARLSTPEQKWETSPLRMKFIHAGLRSDKAPLVFFGLKTLTPALLAGLGYLALQLMGASWDSSTLLLLLVLALVGYYLPNLLLARWVSQRKLEILNAFPDAADLMLICVEAGLGLDAALTRVAEEMQLRSPALAQEIHLTNLEIRAGVTREQALRNLSARTALDEISTFASMLSQSDKFGTSVGESLRVFSDDLRTRRQIRAEELAAKLPTKMLFPLVFCIFPAISMVVLGPAGIRIWHILLPMMTGSGT